MDQGNPMFGEPPKMTAFKGEQAITSAMMDLVEGKKNAVGYVLRPQGTADRRHGRRRSLHPWRPTRARDQPDLAREDLDREREHQVPGIESLRSAGDPGRAQDDHDHRPAVRFLRSRNEIAPRVLGETGAHPSLARSFRAKTPKLQAFLNELGVKVNDDRLMAMVKTGIQEIARVRDVIGTFSSGQSDHETAGGGARNFCRRHLVP